jgi:hypothetical protein
MVIDPNDGMKVMAVHRGAPFVHLSKPDLVPLPPRQKRLRRTRPAQP